MTDSIISTKTTCRSCGGRGLVEDPVKVGARLRAARLAAGLKQSVVAARLGIRVERLSEIESGRRNRRGGWTEKVLRAINEH